MGENSDIQSAGSIQRNGEKCFWGKAELINYETCEYIISREIAKTSLVVLDMKASLRKK